MNLDWLDGFLLFGVFQVVMVIGLALLLHLQMGLVRIANFGVVGFWAIGAYAFGALFIRVDWSIGEPWPFLISMVFGTVVAGLAGLLVGWVISDLDTDGVLVGTLGFATAVAILVTTETGITGGARGIGGLNFPFDIGKTKANELLWFGVLFMVVGGILYYVWRVHRSPYGRLLIAVGDNEPLARSLGKPAFSTKLWLFALGSAGMGLLGAINAVMVHLLIPEIIGGVLRHSGSVLSPASSRVVHPDDPGTARDGVWRCFDHRSPGPAAGNPGRHAARQADPEHAW